MMDKITCGHIRTGMYPECVSVHMKAIEGATRSEINIEAKLCVVCAAQNINLFNILEKLEEPIAGIINIQRMER